MLPSLFQFILCVTWQQHIPWALVCSALCHVCYYFLHLPKYLSRASPRWIHSVSVAAAWNCPIFGGVKSSAKHVQKLPSPLPMEHVGPVQLSINSAGGHSLCAGWLKLSEQTRALMSCPSSLMAVATQDLSLQLRPPCRSL